MNLEKDIIFVNSHPIQYFAPLYKFMNGLGIKTKAWYCSNTTVGAIRDKEFGVEIKWDVPLLDGYESIFFNNHSWKPSHSNGFFGVINLGMILSLFRIKKSVIVVHGWHYLSHLLILLLGKFAGHTVCVRCDIPLKQELKKKGFAQSAKYLAYRYILFPRISKFLYIGEQNRLYYKSYRIADSRLLFCPYAVDNERFENAAEILRPMASDLRWKYNISPADKVIVFSGKYIEKKRPLDLLRAFQQLNQRDSWLIMVGEGKLRTEMEIFIKDSNLSNVILTGFVNQSEISEFYAIADVFVMCSALGENWGLSVNEAMNFGTPLILSDLTGCAEDLVVEEANGVVIETGNIQQLKEALYKILYDNKLSNSPSSLKVVQKYSFREIAEHLKTLIA